MIDTGLTDTEGRVLGVLADAEHEGRLVADLAAPVAIPSVTGTGAEADAQQWVPGVDGGPQAVPALVLQGHVDVVPAGDRAGWPADPFTAQVVATPGGPVVRGRGTCDMKAGLVAALAAVPAVTEAGVRLRGTLAVHSVVSEEDGGLGAFGTLARGHTGAACVIPEPTGRRVITANAGALTLRLEVPGLAAHGSSRYLGVSAIEAFEVVHRALRDLERRRCEDADPLMAEYPLAYPLSIGTVRAGDWASAVPAALVAHGRYGVRLDETPDQARAAFQECVDQACAAHAWLRDHPVRVTWWGGQFARRRLNTRPTRRTGQGVRFSTADRGTAPQATASQGRRPASGGLRVAVGCGVRSYVDGGAISTVADGGLVGNVAATLTRLRYFPFGWSSGGERLGWGPVGREGSPTGPR